MKRLTIALTPYDRTAPLVDGRVAIAGCDAEITCLDNEEMFVRALTKADFDVTEMSFARFIQSVGAGNRNYVGLPIFLSRAFRHSAIYVRTDRIKTPGDLKGRKIGVRNYANTASVMARGMLADEYKVATENVSWLIGDVDKVERMSVSRPSLADRFDVQVVPAGQLLGPMLAAGEIDGLIDFEPPHCFAEGHDAIGRLFPDHVAAERAYFARTRIFPIMHLLIIRRSIAEHDDDLCLHLCAAFDRAKEIAIGNLWSPGALKIALPWVSEEFERTVALMGRDYWPYGVAANLPSIAAGPRYCEAQGLVARAPTLDELFASPTLEI